MRPSPARSYVAVGALALVIGLAAELAAGGASGPKTQLVSRQSQSAGGAGADQDASNAAISANGRYVAFSTAADNLGGPLDTNVSNVYVYDRERRRVELISRRSNRGPGADDASLSPEISASGRYVAFQTTADNLGGPLDTNVDNVYVYDRERKRVELVSRRSNRGPGADGTSFNPVISANGRYVAFATGADNLGGPLDTNVDNVYVYDRERKRVQLISRRSNNGLGGDDHSFSPSISARGRYVAFASEATNLGGPIQTDPLNSEANVYVYDRERKRLQLVSRRSKSQGGAGGNASSSDAFISATGRFVGFESNATNLGGPLQTDPLAFDDNIYVYDRERKRVQLVSRQSKAAGGLGADDDSDDPVLSRDGRFVAFETDADNLGGPTDPGNTGDNAYLYDRERKRVELVGRASGKNGAACNDDCEDPYVSLNGMFVAFEARATNFGGPVVDPADDKVYVRIR